MGVVVKGSKWALLAAVGAVALVPASATGEAPRDKATGGGQIFLTSGDEPAKGALDTLAFTAQRARDASGNSTAATGQVQVNRRTGDSSEQLRFHGEVQCLVVIGNRAYISGEDRRTGDYFELFVEDNGEGGSNSLDQAMFWFDGEETRNDMPENQTPGQFTPPFEESYCNIEEDPDDEVNLARGNYQVHDAP